MRVASPCAPSSTPTRWRSTGGDVAGFLDLFTPDATLATFEPDGSRRSAHHGEDELVAIPPR